MDRIVIMASHAIGYDFRNIKKKGNKRCFDLARNFYMLEKEDPAWEKLVADGKAGKEQVDGKVGYFITDSGLCWLEKELDVVFGYPQMTPAQEQEDKIENLWKLLVSVKAYVTPSADGESVIVYIRKGQELVTFLDTLFKEKPVLSARLYPDRVSFSFQELLGFHVHTEKIMALKPENGEQEADTDV